MTASFYLTCGTCRMCVAGRETLCANWEGFVGVHRDGGFADYVVLPARNLVRVPDGLALDAAGLTSDAVCTAYHAARARARLSPGQRAAVLGAGGGVGIHMVEMARAFGAEVVCVERDPAKAARLRELDLGTVVEPVAGFAAGDLVEAAGGTFDAVFDLVSSSETFALGYGSLSAGGTLVMIGTGGQPGEVIPSDTIAREKTVTGSRNATRSELAEALDLVASGAVRTHVGRRLQLESVNEAFDAVAANDVFGRIVIDVAPGADGGAL